MTTAQRVRRLGLVGEVVLAFAAGATAFALVAVLLAVFDSYALAAALSAPCIAGVVVLARRFGAAFAVPPAMAALLAYDWYVFRRRTRSGCPTRRARSTSSSISRSRSSWASWRPTPDGAPPHPIAPAPY